MEKRDEIRARMQTRFSRYVLSVISHQPLRGSSTPPQTLHHVGGVIHPIAVSGHCILCLSRVSTRSALSILSITSCFHPMCFRHTSLSKTNFSAGKSCRHLCFCCRDVELTPALGICLLWQCNFILFFFENGPFEIDWTLLECNVKTDIGARFVFVRKS